ncbi:hypothetical protein [Burkholderia sp. ABCPW 11]|uniref:hypothetical protein n=1 Tax=Burkholderia sp. ABCPW 11 TaxID=1637859 RepID=UPI0012FDBF6D|nr:hypothetical protein [Burkholderia sp. ABCPW 11]
MTIPSSMEGDAARDGGREEVRQLRRGQPSASVPDRPRAIAPRPDLTREPVEAGRALRSRVAAVGEAPTIDGQRDKDECPALA